MVVNPMLLSIFLNVFFVLNKFRGNVDPLPPPSTYPVPYPPYPPSPPPFSTIYVVSTMVSLKFFQNFLLFWILVSWCEKILAKKLQIIEGGWTRYEIKVNFCKVSGKDGQQKWYTDSGIRPSSKCFNIIPFILYLVHLGKVFLKNFSLTIHFFHISSYLL